MHTSFARQLKKKKATGVWLLTNKRTKHLALQQESQMSCMWFWQNRESWFPLRFPQSQLSSYKPQATCQRLLCKNLTHHGHFFFFFRTCPKKALKAMRRDGSKSVVGERQLFCDSQKKSEIWKNWISMFQIKVSVFDTVQSLVNSSSWH